MYLTNVFHDCISRLYLTIVYHGCISRSYLRIVSHVRILGLPLTIVSRDCASQHCISRLNLTIAPHHSPGVQHRPAKTQSPDERSSSNRGARAFTCRTIGWRVMAVPTCTPCTPCTACTPCTHEGRDNRGSILPASSKEVNNVRTCQPAWAQRRSPSHENITYVPES